MAKKNAKHSHMTTAELIGGGVLFLVYLLIMPLLLQKICTVLGVLLDRTVSASTAATVYYYVMTLVVAALFHKFLGKAGSRFFGNLNQSCVTAGMALVLFYGANELFCRICTRFIMPLANLNDVTITAQIDNVPRTTMLIVLLLAPFVEEVLFRGLVFGWLAERSGAVAYVVSAALYAFGCLWQVMAGGADTASLLVLAQYMIPGLIFAWAYGRSGSVWTAVIVHVAVNALAFVS